MTTSINTAAFAAADACALALANGSPRHSGIVPVTDTRDYVCADAFASATAIANGFSRTTVVFPFSDAVAGAIAVADALAAAIANEHAHCGSHERMPT